MITSRSARVAAAVLAVATVVSLSGCFSGGSSPAPTTTGTGTDLSRYYGQTLTWVDCDNGMECTTAIAPLDWANPSPDTDIELAVVRQPATGKASERLGSLFTNPGGPGASGYDFVYDSVDFAASEDLQRAYDIVGWDPRGVGRSSAVLCYDDPADLDAFIARNRLQIARDLDGDPVFMAQSAYSLQWVEERSPDVKFADLKVSSV